MAQAAAMEQALLNHERVRKSTELPLFYGRKDKDVIDPHDFLKRFETASEIARWVPVPAAGAAPDLARKCQEFYMLLRDRALDWYRSLADIPDFNYNDWNLIKPEFVATYAPRYTARTACLSFGDLIQQNQEGVTDFYLRVSRAYHLLKETRPVDLFDVRRPLCALDGADVAARAVAVNEFAIRVKKEGIEDMGRYMIQQLFTAGLNEDIRIKTMEANEPTLTEAYKKALVFETILKDKRGAKALISSVQKPDDDTQGDDEDEEDLELLEQVNAIRIKRGKKPIRFTSQNKGRFDNRNRIVINCRYCKKPGHFQRDCIKRKRENGAMIDQHGKPYKVSSLNQQEEDQQEEDGNDQIEDEDDQRVQSIGASSFYGINSIRSINQNGDDSDTNDETSQQEESNAEDKTSQVDETEQKHPTKYWTVNHGYEDDIPGLESSSTDTDDDDPTYIMIDTQKPIRYIYADDTYIPTPGPMETKESVEQAAKESRKPVFSGYRCEHRNLKNMVEESKKRYPHMMVNGCVEYLDERAKDRGLNSHHGKIHAIRAVAALEEEEKDEIAGYFGDPRDDPDYAERTRNLRAKWFQETSDSNPLN